MDIKEVSVHSSKRSNSKHSRSQNSMASTAQKTIDSVTLRITIDPVPDLLKKMTIPEIINCLFDSFVVGLYALFAWFYCGKKGIIQFAIAYPISAFVSQALPKAINQGTVAQLSQHIADNEIKKADELMCYYFIVQVAYLILSCFLAFFITLSFPSIALIDVNANPESDLGSGYIALTCTVGTLLSIFNDSCSGLLMAENKFALNLYRGATTKLLEILFILLSFQLTMSNGNKPTLLQIGLGQCVGQFFPAIAMILYYQDFYEFPFQGVIKAKFKYMKQFNVQTLMKIIMSSLPKVMQFGGHLLMNFFLNVAVTINYKLANDIFVTRVGLLYYYITTRIYGFGSDAYLYVSQGSIGLNLTLKKYVRSKEILTKGLVYSIVIQVILLIVGMLTNSLLVPFFMPRTEQADIDFLLLYAQPYITQASFLPILDIPYHFAQAVNNIDGKWYMTLVLSIMYPFIAILTLIVVQTTVGDGAMLTSVFLYSSIFSGIVGLIVFARTLIEVFQLAKIELRRLKKQKKAAEIDAQIAQDGLHDNADDI